jgi:hypothetical protein
MSAGHGVERHVHCADEDERGTEEDSFVVEHTRDCERRDEHRHQRCEERSADGTLVGIDRVGQRGVCGPCPPQRGEDEDATSDSGEGRITGEQRRHLGERKDEHEVEEELDRCHPVFVLDRRRNHRRSDPRG